MADAFAPSVAASRVNAPKVLDIQGIAKSYGATVAVRRVSFDIEPGEIHALLGENGAGKSTIVKVLSGIVAPDTGVLTLDGHAYAPADPMAARAAGVSTAFQELSLLPNLSVAENLMLPRQAKKAGLVSVKAGEARRIRPGPHPSGRLYPFAVACGKAAHRNHARGGATSTPARAG
jgi:ribose transport system ATP-binding protein